VSETLSKAMSLNPFLDRLPIIIDNIIPVKGSNQWLLKDERGKGVTISPSFQFPWKLMALSGGAPLKLFALGKEQEFEPLGAWVNGRYKLLV
jgi:hypothetical protein